MSSPRRIESLNFLAFPAKNFDRDQGSFHGISRSAPTNSHFSLGSSQQGPRALCHDNDLISLEHCRPFIAQNKHDASNVHKSHNQRQANQSCRSYTLHPSICSRVVDLGPPQSCQEALKKKGRMEPITVESCIIDCVQRRAWSPWSSYVFRCHYRV